MNVDKSILHEAVFHRKSNQRFKEESWFTSNITVQSMCGMYWQGVKADTPCNVVPVTHPWKRGEAKGLPPTNASLNLSLKEPSPVPPSFT